MDVVVFCYNRPDKLKMCLEAINLDYTDKLWIFCDGAKNEAHAAGVKMNLEIAEKFAHENKKVIFRPHNFGTPKNVISGLDEVFSETDSCFILEDDCIVKPEAYAYVDWALKTFRDETDIFSVNTMSPLNGLLNRIAARFIKNDVVACTRVFAFWGWATWADRWYEFRKALEPFNNPFGKGSNIPFSYGSHVKYTIQQFEAGKVGGWDARLMVLTMNKSKLYLHPKKSLMRNIGLDGTGLHFRSRQSVIKDVNELSFSGFVPKLNKEKIDIKKNQLIKILLIINDMAIMFRSKILAFLPLEIRARLKKIIFGNKTKYSQF